MLRHEPRRCAPLPHGKSPDLPGSHPVEVAHWSLLLRSCALPLALCAFGTASALSLSNEIGVGGPTCGCPAWCSGFGVPTPPPVQWSASPSEFKAAAGSGTPLEIAWRRVKHTPGRVSPLRSQSAGSSGRRARARKPRSYVTTYWRGGLGFLRWAYPLPPPWPSCHQSFVASPLLFVQREVMS